MSKKRVPRRTIPCPECGRLLNHGHGKRSGLFALHRVQHGSAGGFGIVTGVCPGSERIWAEWFPHTLHFISILDRDRNRRLTVSVTPDHTGETDRFLVVAIETAIDASINGIMDEHQHRNIGVFDSISDAKRAGEESCLRWLESPSGVPCPCKEIASV